MAFESIDKLVKDRFVSIISKADQDAQSYFNDNYLPDIQKRSLFDNFVFLKSEIDRLKKEKDNFPIPQYIDNHSSEEWLLKTFSSRTVILNIDESDLLYSGVYLGKLNSHIADHYHELSVSIPAYTYNDFISNKYDPFLLELDYYYHIPEKEHLKIKEWQVDKLIKVITHETGLLVKEIQSQSKLDPDPLKVIRYNLDIFKTQYENKSFSSTSDLIATLKQFTFLKNYDFNLLSSADTLQVLDNFYNEKISWSKVMPVHIDNLRSKFSNNPLKFAYTDSPYIFYTISKLCHWMQIASDNNDINYPFQIPDYEKLLSVTLSNAKTEAKKQIKEFDIANNAVQLDDESLYSLYLNKFNTLRNEYNEEGFFKLYYTGIYNPDSLKLLLSTNCFFSNDEKANTDPLSKAVILRDNILHYYNRLIDIKGTHHILGKQSKGDVAEVMFLMHNMVLDADLHKRLSQIMDKTISDFEEYPVPFELIRWNINESLEELFNDSIDRLLQYLEDCEGTNKVLYVHTRLKQLKQRELEFKRWRNEGFDIDTGKYTTLFKEYLEIEADYIRDTKDINIIPSLAIGANIKLLDHPVNQQTSNIPNSYSLNPKNSKLTNITDFLNSMIHQGFISPDTDIIASRKIFNNEIPDPPITWIGNISELKFLIGYIHNELKVISDLKGNIWKVTAKCFIDTDGNHYDYTKFRGQKAPAKADMLCIAANNLK